MTAPVSTPVAPPSKTILALVIFLSLVGVTGAVYLFIKGGTEATVQAVSILGFLAPTIAALLAYKGVRDVHTAVNSKLDALLKLTASEARAEGKIEGHLESDALQRRVTDQLDPIDGGLG